jgi:hypothetical protein
MIFKTASKVRNVSNSGTMLNIDQKSTSLSSTVDVIAMTGGRLDINQYGTDQKVTVSSYGGSITTINQGANSSGTTAGYTADHSTLILTNNGVAAPTGYTMTVNQTGSYQDTTLNYEHGFNGTLNLDQQGTASAKTTANITL